MTYRIYDIEVEEAFKHVFIDGVASNAFDSRVYATPSHLGKGNISIRALGEIILTEQKFLPHQQLSISHLDNHSNSDYCFLGFTLAGRVALEASKPERSFSFGENYATLGLSTREDRFTMNLNQEYTHHISFNFSKQTLLAYLKEFDDSQLIQKAEKAQQFTVLQQFKLKASHLHLIAKILQNPYRGALRKIYFESCAHELLITLLKDICTRKHYKLTLTPNDKACIQRARDILYSDLQNPPTIDHLAKRVGINQDKLKKGFKAEFGKTIFAEITQARMEKAYKTLRQEDVTVAEMAYQAGYVSVSNFIVAFKKHYGITPGQMRKSRSYYWTKQPNA